MKQLLILALVACASTAFAADVTVSNRELGSGVPGATAPTNAVQWDNDMYHAPQYMAGYPTAATIFPRVIEVQCTRAKGVVECGGYNWDPSMGRSEYLLIKPVIKEVPVIKISPPKKKAE